MEFAQNTNITFTERAASVRNGPVIRDQLLPRFGLSARAGEIVRFEGCAAAFVVLFRDWSIGPSHETVRVVLDLLPDDSPLRVVN